MGTNYAPETHSALYIPHVKILRPPEPGVYFHSISTDEETQVQRSCHWLEVTQRLCHSQDVNVGLYDF